MVVGYLDGKVLDIFGNISFEFGLEGYGDVLFIYVKVDEYLKGNV